MTWNVEYTDEFETWWTEKLKPDEQDEIAAVPRTLRFRSAANSDFADRRPEDRPPTLVSKAHSHC